MNDKVNSIVISVGLLYATFYGVVGREIYQQGSQSLKNNLEEE